MSFNTIILDLDAWGQLWFSCYKDTDEVFVCITFIAFIYELSSFFPYTKMKTQKEEKRKGFPGVREKFLPREHVVIFKMYRVSILYSTQN